MQCLNHICPLYVNNNDDGGGELLLVGLHFDTHTALHASDPSINQRKPAVRVIIKDIPLPIYTKTDKSSSMFVLEIEIIIKVTIC